ncbi:hypothetical protein LG943_02735 [Streptomonospora sp. S1-112]|uniref:Uncharacterized protein n=1 Tax=Streptomonospora mangrovi TaxID=2883123 RepID=A0A9X3SDZ4_9ACTN|nr:hypothetical protein [Streptomonospora mangrovi]MDA0563250.1 hypothetical protein [Streptomonospora mangrovi]
MVDAWMPGAKRVPCSNARGGQLQGGAPRAVWTTTESDPAALSARAVAQRLNADGRSAHLVWNPLTGETVQLLPATAPAAGQLTAEGTDRACEGRVCLVIQVIGHTLAPFTDSPLRELDPILRWLDSWRVPRRWPAGPPPANPGPAAERGDERLWARGGHFGHSQVPGATAAGPGAIAPQRLLDPRHRAQPPGPAVPPPRPVLAPAEPAGAGARPYVGAARG